MDEMLKNVPMWVTWVFSGIGVTILGWIGILLFRKGESKVQTQKAGDGAIQIISGGDTNIKRE